MNGAGAGDPEAMAKAAKLAAEARTAEAAADKAEQEGREAASPLAKSKREAEAQKAISEAHQQAAEAQQKQVAALLPDFSKAPSGSLETKGEEPLFGTSLAEHATAAAARRVAELAGEALEGDHPVRILVTSDSDLASSDAIYVEIVEGLDQLTKAARGMIDESAAPAAEGTPKGILPLLPVIGAVAAALPSALSLITAHRTLSTASVTVDSLAAAASVAGELAQSADGVTVFHDDVRVLPEGGVVQAKLTTLADCRQELVGKKLALEDEKSAEDAELTKLLAEVKDADDQLGKASEAERPGIEAKLGEQRGHVEQREAQVGKSTTRIGLIDSTLSAIDRFTGSLQTTVEGAKHSPLTAAILREQLHPTAGAKKFTHVLMVKAQGGSAQQLLDAHAVRHDRFATIATSTVVYLLVETVDGSVVRAGSIGGEAKISGKLGEDFKIRAYSSDAGAE